MDGIDLTAVHDLRPVTEVSLSPSGDRVAFVAEESDPEADETRTALYVAPTDGSRDPHRLSRASSAAGPTWGPDGDRLAFLAARDDDLAREWGRTDGDGDADGDGDEAGDSADGDDAAGGDAADDGANGDADDDTDDADERIGEGPRPQVWVYDLALGGDARQVTTFPEGVSGFDLAPDGERLVAAARDPTETDREYLRQRREDDGPIEVTRLQHKADGVGWLDDVTTYLFVCSLDEAFEPTRLDDAYGAGGFEALAGLQPAWGPDDRIAFCRNAAEWPDDSGAYDVFTIAPDGTDTRRLTDGARAFTQPTWAPDGGTLAVVGRDHENWYRPAEVFHLTDDPAHAVGDGPEDTSVAPGDGDYESLSAALDRTVARQGTLAWLDDETVVVPIADEAWTRLAVLPVDGEPRRAYDRQGRHREIEAFDLAGDTVALGLARPDAPPEVYTLDAGELRPDETGGPLTGVSALNEDWAADRPLPDAEVRRYENSDGDEIEAVTYYPADYDPETDDPRPTVVAIHGGPMSYDAPTFRFDVAYWTSHGYVVAKPNYRGSTSYGRDFAERLKGTRGELETDDVVSLTDELVADGVADPDRLFCTGFSYGGITTAHVVTRTDQFAAAAPEHGIYDFYGNFGTDDNHNWHDWEFGVPWENHETYREISSLSRIGEVDTPLLITAGEEDWRCPPTQAEQLYVSVRKQGVDAKLVIYTGENHDIDDPSRTTRRIEELHDWFRAHDPAVETDDDADETA